MAKKLGRRFIGIERQKDYAKIAEKRLAAVRPIEDLALAGTPAKRGLPRVPFGWLIERGLIRPGEVLTDHRGRHSARVFADGSLSTPDFRGSIPQVGAFVQNAPACNGWQFWWRGEGKDKVCIDVLRQKVRAKMH